MNQVEKKTNHELAPSRDGRSNAAARRMPVAPTYRTTSTDERVVLHVELPGVAPEDVRLHVEEQVLHLDAKSSLEPVRAGGLRQHVEFTSPDFQGRWRLPENVDIDAIGSRLRNGVLELTVPLRRPARREIPVQEA